MKLSVQMICVLVLTAFATTAFGAQQPAGGDLRTFQIGQRGVSIEVPSGWTARMGGFGADLTVTGPKGRGERATVTISHIGDTDSMRFDDAKTEETRYRAERMELLKMRDGKFLSLIPYRKLSFGEVTGFSIGYRYSTWGKSYVENSSFLYCKGSVYQLQSQSLAAEERGTSKAFERILAGFACR